MRSQIKRISSITASHKTSVPLQNIKEGQEQTTLVSAAAVGTQLSAYFCGPWWSAHSEDAPGPSERVKNRLPATTARDKSCNR